MSISISKKFDLEPLDNNRLANLCGSMDDNLKTVERRLGVKISYSSNQFKVMGVEIQQVNGFYMVSYIV